MGIPQTITLVRFIDGIMLIALHEQEGAHAVVRVYSRERERKPEYSGVCCLHEMFRDAGVWNTQEYLI